MNSVTDSDLADVLAFIRGYIMQEGFPPSRREIQRAMNFSSLCMVALRIDHLRERGLLEVKPAISRGVTPTQRGWEWNVKR